MEWSRRMFLAGLMGLPALGLAREPGDLDVFLTLSANLTGVPLAELDREAGAAYLQAFRSWGEPIDRALASHALGGLSARVLELWYTGRYETPSGHVVAAYRTALAWKALDFAHPPTYCGQPWWLPPRT